MAAILMQYYKYIEEQKGFMGKLALATKTLVPSIQAAITPDTPEYINIFRKAILEITGEQAPDFSYLHNKSSS